MSADRHTYIYIIIYVHIYTQLSTDTCMHVCKSSEVK